MKGLVSASKIINNISKLFALTPLSYDKSKKKYKVSVQQLIYNSMVLAIYSISFVTDVRKSDSISAISIWMDLVTGYVAQINAIISATVYRKIIIRQFYSFSEMDETLKKLNKPVDYNKLNKFTWLGFGYIVGMFLVTFVSDYFIFASDKTTLYLVFSYFSIFSIDVVNLRMCIVLHMILCRLKLTNEYLESLKCARFQSMVYVPYGNNSKCYGVNMGNAIFTVQILHGKLCRQCENVNKIYGFQIFILVTSVFLICVTHLFYCIEIFNEFSVSFTFFLDLYFTLQWIFLNVFQLLIIVYFADNIKTEIFETSRIMSTMQDLVCDAQSRSGIQIFLMKEIHQETNISACGLFTIDKSLIMMVLGLVTSYLLVMVQIENAKTKEITTNSSETF